MWALWPPKGLYAGFWDMQALFSQACPSGGDTWGEKGKLVGERRDKG